jgi:hypothetical protein
MGVMRNNWIRNSLVALAFGGLAVAQDQPPVPPTQDQPPVQTLPAPAPAQSSSGGWQHFPSQDPASQNPAPQNQAPPMAPQATAPVQNQGGYQGGYSSTVPPAYQAPMVPSTLNLVGGTYLTVRTTNPLSTDHNQVGDAFSAVLTEPIVINGFVVARRGQVVQGRVSTVEKAGRVSGTSKLGLELTQLTLVDGQQLNLHSQMVMRDGGTSYGRDAAAIGTTTAVGAAIGAGVNGGVGAGVGAAGGLVVSTLGVLLTRGKPAVIYPETVLTFKVLDPVTISTANSAGAFRPVGQQDYDSNSRRLVSSQAPRPGYAPYGAPAYAPGYAPAPYYAAPYPYYAYPFYGPSVYFYGGRYFRRW